MPDETYFRRRINGPNAELPVTSKTKPTIIDAVHAIRAAPEVYAANDDPVILYDHDRYVGP